MEENQRNKSNSNRQQISNRQQTSNRQQIRKRQKLRNRSIAISFFAMLSFLAAISFAVLAGYYKLQVNQLEKKAVETGLDGQGIYTEEEVMQMLLTARQEASEEVTQEYLAKMKELVLEGNGTINMLRYFYPDQIVFMNSGRYYFMDVNENLDQHPYLTENIVINDDQTYEYYEDGLRVSHKGIDVSSFQGKIDWERVAADGVEFAIIRMGIRGYGTGKLVVDERFEENMAGALAAGIDVGVYFFTAAVNEQEAVEEAEFLIEAMEPFQIQCTVVIDVEDVNSDSARTNGLTQEEWTNHCIAFCERVKEAGYTPMVYGNMQTFLLMLQLERLEQYDKWFAAYLPYFYYPYDFEIWQYSDNGRVDGISENVDLNISFYDWSSQQR